MTKRIWLVLPTLVSTITVIAITTCAAEPVGEAHVYKRVGDRELKPGVRQRSRRLGASASR